MPKLTEKDRNTILRAMSLLTQLGLTVVFCLAAGIALGWWLDVRFDTSPWLLIIFSLLGLGAAVKSLFDLIKRIIK